MLKPGMYVVRFLGIAIAAAVCFSGVMAGCGRIIDKDGIRIAKIGDKYITRGDLFKLIREMPDTDRSKIFSRGDYLRVLNKHIDERIKLPLGKKLKEEQKIDVPLDAAREQYFRENPQEEEQLRSIYKMEVPKNGEITPLMKMYDLTPDRLQFQKDNIEEEAGRVQARMLGEKAVEYLAAQAYKEGKITVSEEEIDREYAFEKDKMKTLEEMGFTGIRFPAALPDAPALAARLQERLKNGESFDTLLREYVAKGQTEGQAYVIESEIANNPTLERFKGFWEAASGANPGDILGPIYLPAYQQVAEDSQGRRRAVNMPDAYLVLRVTKHTPETTLTKEQAKPMLAAPLVVGKMMELLRQESGVEIYEDKLPEVDQMGMKNPGI